MKALKYIITSFLLMVAATGCQDFEELEKNVNKPNSVPPSLVLNGVLNNLYEAPWNPAQRQNQYWACNYNYYGTNEYWSTASLDFIALKNILKMEDEAKKSGAEAVNPYSAIGKFLKAYFYVRMSQRVGDLPLSEALQGLKITTPKYDTQKEVYLQVLTWLDEANSEIAQLIGSANLTLAGDFYFNNNLAKWQKLVNTFKLRVLISLSKKESDPDLNIKSRFQAVMNAPATYPVMTSIADNLQYVYNGTTNNYPVNPGNRGFDKGRYNTSATILGLLTSLNDPRTFIVANPAKAKTDAGVAPDDFAAYVGAPMGESLDNMASKAGAGQYSFTNQKRYYSTFKGPEPAVQIGYQELCFNIAEAINRGWVTGSAATYYNNGITASMAFFGIQNGTVLEITEPNFDAVIGTYTASVTNYLAQPAVVYAGDNATGLNQILTQKYLAMFQSSGQEAYFNYRRTGVPVFNEGPGTGNSNKIPRRWLYPVSEATNNVDNYTAAVSRQFGSAGDNLNAELWINQ